MDVIFSLISDAQWLVAFAAALTAVSGIISAIGFGQRRAAKKTPPAETIPAPQPALTPFKSTDAAKLHDEMVHMHKDLAQRQKAIFGMIAARK